MTDPAEARVRYTGQWKIPAFALPPLGPWPQPRSLAFARFSCAALHRNVGLCGAFVHRSEEHHCSHDERRKELPREQIPTTTAIPCQPAGRCRRGHAHLCRNRANPAGVPAAQRPQIRLLVGQPEDETPTSTRAIVAGGGLAGAWAEHRRRVGALPAQVIERCISVEYRSLREPDCHAVRSVSS